MALVTESWIEDCVDFGTIADASSVSFLNLIFSFFFLVSTDLCLSAFYYFV